MKKPKRKKKPKTKAKGRSAKSGRYVSKKAVARSPETTVSETPGDRQPGAEPEPDQVLPAP